MFRNKRRREMIKLEERVETIERDQRAREEWLKEEAYCKEVCVEVREAAAWIVPNKMGKWGCRVTDYPAIRAMGHRLQSLADDGYIVLTKNHKKKGTT